MHILFPLMALLFVALALAAPSPFIALKSAIMPLLMLVMLAMGLTLRWQDFVQVWQYKAVVALGVLVQYTVMPLAAWALASAFQFSDVLMVGMILVGATAGGTASNVMTYLAGGHVALSVSMTLVSTLLAVVALPLLTWLYLGQTVPVPVASMMQSLLLLIVLPIALGMGLRRFFDAAIGRVLPWLTPLAMAAIVLIIAIVVALNQSQLTQLAGLLIVAVMLHNLIGMLGGYLGARVAGYDSVIARTMAIEVGMQNSGLSVALALKYYTAAAALPGALFSVWHNISGVIWAAYWQKRDTRQRR
ncbi:MAG: bile acid:sodium symporter family protein [Thiomicrospira sp.]|nr:bile acid:sodium symporter family protein [Thiomicrospira sp.]